MTFESYEIILNPNSISILQNDPQAKNIIEVHVIEDDFNLQMELILIADIQSMVDIKPMQAISIPSNPTERCSCGAAAIGDVGVIQ